MARRIRTAMPTVTRVPATGRTVRVGQADDGGLTGSAEASVRPVSNITVRLLAIQRLLQPSLAAARPIISPRRACIGAFLSLMRASNSGGAVSGEPALNGGAGLYSSRN